MEPEETDYRSAMAIAEEAEDLKTRRADHGGTFSKRSLRRDLANITVTLSMMR
jgi:hypothetical protein